LGPLASRSQKQRVLWNRCAPMMSVLARVRLHDLWRTHAKRATISPQKHLSQLHRHRGQSFLLPPANKHVALWQSQPAKRRKSLRRQVSLVWDMLRAPSRNRTKAAPLRTVDGMRGFWPKNRQIQRFSIFLPFLTGASYSYYRRTGKVRQ